MRDKRKKLAYTLLAILLSYIMVVGAIYLPAVFAPVPGGFEIAHSFVISISIIYLIIVLLLVPFLLALIYIPSTEKALREKLLQTALLISAAIFLVISLSPPLMALLHGADTEYVFQALLYGFREGAGVFIMISPVLFVLIYPLSRYMGTERRTPYPNLLFLSMVLLFLYIPILRSLQFVLHQKILQGIMTLLPFPIIFILLAVSPRIRLLSLSARPVQDPEVADLLNAAKKELGIRNSISVFSVRAVAGHAAVFGMRRIFLVVSEELLEALRSARWLVEAVLLHELVHVRNRDTALKELTGAAWKAFALSAVPVVLLKEINVANLFLLTCVLLYFLDRWISRNREIYADMIVSESGRNILRALKLLSLPGRSRSLFSRPLQLERIEALENPWKTFIPGFLKVPCSESF